MHLLFGIILGLAVLVFLVVIHELGHAIAARRNGVVVEEFGIGFPPRAWGKKLKNGVLFSLNWLPLGGFVKLQGEHDSARKKGDYGAATFWQKTRILLAGVLVNWVAAAVLFTILAWTGLPKLLANQVTVPSDTKTIRSTVQVVNVVDDYPAAEAGFKSGDKILRFAGEEVPTTSSLIDIANQHKGDTVDVIYSRDNVEASKTVHLKENNNGNGIFGAGLGQQERIKATWSAPIVGVATTAQFTWETLAQLGILVKNVAVGLVMQLSPNEATRASASAGLAQAGSSVAGPIGILGVIFPAVEQQGITQIIMLAAIISLTLAVMNVLPIPALDGGRWFTMAVFRLLRKPLTKEREERIQATGFMLLMGLVVIVTVSDVGKLF